MNQNYLFSFFSMNALNVKTMKSMDTAPVASSVADRARLRARAQRRARIEPTPNQIRMTPVDPKEIVWQAMDCIS